MEGKDEPPELRGIIPGTFNYVFDMISQQSKYRTQLQQAGRHMLRHLLSHMWEAAQNTEPSSS